MKSAFAENISRTGLTVGGRRRWTSSVTLPFQRPIAFRHQDEKDGVSHAEQRAERDVRQIALRPVIKCRARVGQCVKRTDEDQSCGNGIITRRQLEKSSLTASP